MQEMQGMAEGVITREHRLPKCNNLNWACSTVAEVHLMRKKHARQLYENTSWKEKLWEVFFQRNLFLVACLVVVALVVPDTCV